MLKCSTIKKKFTSQLKMLFRSFLVRVHNVCIIFLTLCTRKITTINAIFIANIFLYIWMTYVNFIISCGINILKGPFNIFCSFFMMHWNYIVSLCTWIINHKYNVLSLLYKAEITYINFKTIEENLQKLESTEIDGHIGWR